MEKSKGILYAVLSSLGFGLMPIWAKDAISRGANSITLVFLRFFIAAILMFFYLRVKRVNLKLTKNQLAYIVLIITFGIAATSLGLFISYNYIPVGLVTAIHFAYPAVVSIIMVVMFKEKVTKGKILAIALSFVGVYLLAYNGNDCANIKGIMIAASTAVFFAIYVIGINRGYAKGINDYIITFYVSVISSIVLFLFAKITGNFELVLNPIIIKDVLYLSVISTVASVLLFIKGVKIIGSINASILSTLEPISSIFFGVLILNESINYYIIVGSLFIITSVIVLTSSERVREKRISISEGK